MGMCTLFNPTLNKCFFLLMSLRKSELPAFGMAWNGRGWEEGNKHSMNPPRYSQLSSCMVHVWMSMGKFLRSMGQDRINVSLEEAEERRELLELGQSVRKARRKLCLPTQALHQRGRLYLML